MTSSNTLRFVLFLLLCFGLICKADHVPRKWTNSAGVSMQATLARVEGNQVDLLLDSGRVITIKLSNLSQADQDYVRDWQTAQTTLPAPSVEPQPQATPAPQPQATARPVLQNAPVTTSEAEELPNQQSLPLRQQANLLLKQNLFQKGRAPDPLVRPKAEIYLPFPELGASHTTGEPMGLRIRIPDNYRPDRPVPLIVWMAGGDGSSWYHEAEQLVDQRDFVMVGMNYPAAFPAPQIMCRQGQAGKIWEIQEKMLVKLVEMIPNLDPRLRIVTGFSNGAHMIGGCIAQKEASFYGFFNVYVLVEGGYSNTYSYPQLPGRYFYFTWGTGKGGDGNAFGATLTNAAKKAGMNVEAHPMEGVGHDFPATEEQKIKAWIRGVVMPALAPDI